jgi:hypothetical protein
MIIRTHRLGRRGDLMNILESLLGFKSFGSEVFGLIKVKSL